MLASTDNQKQPMCVNNYATKGEISMAHGEKIIAFIEQYCKIPEDAQVGEPIKRMKQFILDVYDNSHGTSRAYLSVARKNDKSALIAAVVPAHLVGPEAKQNSQIISGARSCDQARGYCCGSG